MATKKSVAESAWSQCRSKAQTVLTSPQLWQRYVAARSNPEQETEAIVLRNRIARENDRLVRKIAHQMAGECAEPLEDITQLGQLGLIRAIEKFDPDQGRSLQLVCRPLHSRRSSTSLARPLVSRKNPTPLDRAG
jgi:DNA-directed RNA polymerase sigma subunit (sigma70/sigma32)